jgi:hypothetical protein
MTSSPMTPLTQLHDPGVAREVQESADAAHALAVVALHVGAETSFSGRTPGLRRSSSSSASAIWATRGCGSRKRGMTQPSRA